MALPVSDQYVDRANIYRQMTAGVPTLHSLATFVRGTNDGEVINWTTIGTLLGGNLGFWFGDRISVYIKGTTTILGKTLLK